MTHSHEIAFIDPAVTDADVLLSGLRPDVEAIVLSGAEPAVAQMARLLEGRTNLDAIHVIGHGRPGEVGFASGAFGIETVKAEAAALSGIGAALVAQGALLIWACQAGAGVRGAAFVAALAKATGACVAAAAGLVGGHAQGGKWALDHYGGPVGPPLTPQGMASYAGVLVNKIVLENMKQGNPESEWGIEGSGSANIQGFATEISRNVGQTVDFKIATDSTDYRIEIYRLGYYGGAGARKVATIQKTLGSAQVQPHPIVDASRGLIDAGNWSVSASWAIPGMPFPASTSPSSSARTARKARARSRSSSATTARPATSSSRLPTPPGKPTMNGEGQVSISVTCRSILPI